MPDQIRILTINTHKGLSTFARRSLLPKLKEAIQYISADLVFLQEVHGEHKRRAKTKSQYEFLADTIWPEFAYGKNAIYPAGDHGNAILSKYPIKQSKNIDISPHKLEKRGFLHCEMTLPKSKKSIHCICVHLALLHYHRKKQLDRLKEYIGENIEKSDPLIIAGDFNDWGLKAVKHFAEPLKLTEAYSKFKGVHAKTFPAFMPMLKVDRIYLRKLKVSNAEVLFSGAFKTISDHVALSADVELDEKMG